MRRLHGRRCTTNLAVQWLVGLNDDMVGLHADDFISHATNRGEDLSIGNRVQQFGHSLVIHDPALRTLHSPPRLIDRQTDPAAHQELPAVEQAERLPL
jgi:hypothetical protein